jgi:hypothetical protein
MIELIPYIPFEDKTDMVDTCFDIIELTKFINKHLSVYMYIFYDKILFPINHPKYKLISLEYNRFEFELNFYNKNILEIDYLEKITITSSLNKLVHILKTYCISNYFIITYEEEQKMLVIKS